MFGQTVSFIPSILASMNSWLTPTVLFVLLNIMIGTIAFTSSLANQKHSHSQNTQNDDAQRQILLARTPSVLQRIKSNFYRYKSQDPHPSEPIATHFNNMADTDTKFSLEHKAETHTFFQQNADSDTHFALETKIGSQNFFQQTLFDPTLDSDTQYARNQISPLQTQFEGEEPTLDEVYSQLKDRHVNRANSDTKPVGGEMPERLPAKMRKSASAKSAFAHFERKDIVEARPLATAREGNARVTKDDDDDDGVDSKADDFINKFKQQLKLQRLDSVMRYKDMIARGSEK